VTVTVRLFATFRDLLPQAARREGLQMDVHQHDTIRTVMQALGVPDDLPKIVLVNGRHASEDSRLADGDIVSVFPPLIGGRSSAEQGMRPGGMPRRPQG
jgi:molybdopterin synthase sulfur carrier subunit